MNFVPHQHEWRCSTLHICVASPRRPRCGDPSDFPYFFSSAGLSTFTRRRTKQAPRCPEGPCQEARGWSCNPVPPPTSALPSAFLSGGVQAAPLPVLSCAKGAADLNIADSSGLNEAALVTPHPNLNPPQRHPATSHCTAGSSSMGSARSDMQFTVLALAMWGGLTIKVWKQFSSQHNLQSVLGMLASERARWGWGRVLRSHAFLT